MKAKHIDDVANKCFFLLLPNSSKYLVDLSL